MPALSSLPASAAPERRYWTAWPRSRVAALHRAPMTFWQVVHAVLAESAVSYTVGFAADAAGSTLEFRDLRIETAQPGLQLVYPRGYLARPRSPTAAGREREIVSVLTSPVESKEISLRMELQETTAKGNRLCASAGSIPGSDMPNSRRGRDSPSRWTSRANQISAEGRDLGGLDFPLAATLDAAQSQRLRQAGTHVGPNRAPVFRSHRTAASRPMTGIRAGPVPYSCPCHATPIPACRRSLSAADTNLRWFVFQVAPKKGEFVTDLRPEEIVVKEDGAPQKIAVFEGGRFYPRTVPVEISLLSIAVTAWRWPG